MDWIFIIVYGLVAIGFAITEFAFLRVRKKKYKKVENNFFEESNIKFFDETFGQEVKIDNDYPTTNYVKETYSKMGVKKPRVHED